MLVSILDLNQRVLHVDVCFHTLLAEVRVVALGADVTDAAGVVRTAPVTFVRRSPRAVLTSLGHVEFLFNVLPLLGKAGHAQVGGFTVFASVLNCTDPVKGCVSGVLYMAVRADLVLFFRCLAIKGNLAVSVADLVLFFRYVAIKGSDRAWWFRHNAILSERLLRLGWVLVATLGRALARHY